jgi:hypothetical protein
MTIQLSEPMQNLLKSMGFGYAWDAFGVTGPLTHAARVRTCEALVKRGLLTISHEHYDLTDTGQTIAAGFDQINKEYVRDHAIRKLNNHCDPAPPSPIGNCI